MIYSYIHIAVILIKILFLTKSYNLSCLDLNDTIRWNRNFHFKNKEIPVVIDVSSRASHNILSQIVKILLQERLGYKQVEFKFHEESSVDDLISRLGCADSSCVNGNPVSHINVEVWIPPGYTLSDSRNKQTLNCGPLGPTARKGNFVNADMARKTYAESGEIIDNWRVLDKIAEICQPGSKDFCNKTIYRNNPDSNINESMKQPYPSMLFMNWFPNVDTVQGNFTRVLYPDCWRSYPNGTCNFEVNQLTKIIWSHLKVHADKIYYLIKELNLSHDEFVNLLKDVDVTAIDSQKEYYRVACKWLRNNTSRWSPWTVNWNVKDKVYLPILVSDYDIWKAKQLMNASISRIKTLNDNVFNDTHYVIIPEIHEVVCDIDIILNRYLSLIEKYGKKIMGFIVSICPRTFDVLIKISDMQKRIIISASMVSTHSMNVTGYKYFFSTHPNMNHYNLVLIKMFQHLNWAKVVVLQKDDNLLDIKMLMRYGINVLACDTTKEAELEYYKTYAFLQIAKKEHKASIFIVDYSVHGTQIVMCAASNLGMTLDTDYVFILNPLLDPFWWKNATNKYCPDIKLINKQYFIIKHDTSSEHVQDYSRNNEVTYNNLAQRTQDAISYLGNSFHQLIKVWPSAYFSLQAPPISEKFVDILANQSQIMLAQSNKYVRKVFNQNHERNGVWQIQRVSTSQGFFVAITGFKWNITSGFDPATHLPKLVILRGFSTLNDTNRESDCQVETLRNLFNWSCTGTLIFINVICIVFGIGFLIVALIWYYRRQAVIMEDRYKKPFEDLCAELADIDIRSSDVVISLQVGKGAFGIVYGGEAKRNTRWESVAIKLIKKEVDYQGKIDFLTEAKLMRNLEHPNIVKLIGICLNPLKPAIYLVMELVVNGDLEDYLLTNRITANKDPNNKLVCPSLLTKFVKNIASGTEYLHKNSLLHRDLACRNCFLSEDYVVKIGDFGLTRDINESNANQYYRTARHFILPARWMPPEAVQFGYFSVQSDIWSLGVVIFEIATFCSRPYFNVTDEEVPEIVKRNTMPLVNYLPEAAKNSGVYKLIDKCCQYKREERPQSMSEVVKYLEDYSDCIRPYITNNPPQAASIGVFNIMNPYENHQRPSSMASIGLNRFKSTSRSRTSVGFSDLITDNQNSINAYMQTDSDVDRDPFHCNPEQVPFIPNEMEFITSNNTTNRAGSKKRQQAHKKSSSNLNSSKSRSSDFMTHKIDDDQEQSCASCPDPGNVQCLGDFDVQDFPCNDTAKYFVRSTSGDEKSVTSTKKMKSIRNGKVVYSGSSRSHKSKGHKFGVSGKSKSSHVMFNRKMSEGNGVRHEFTEPLLYDRLDKVCIQPVRVDKGTKALC